MPLQRSTDKATATPAAGVSVQVRASRPQSLFQRDKDKALARRDKGSDRLMANQSSRSILDAQRVKALLEAMVWDGKTVHQAAAIAGVRVKRARLLLTLPDVRAEYMRLIQSLRLNEAARNVHKAIEIRDDEVLKETPTGRKTQLQALAWLHGTDGAGASGAGGTQVQVNIGVPGYVIDLSGEQEGPRLIDSQPLNRPNSLTENS